MSYRDSVRARRQHVDLTDLMLSGLAGTCLRLGLGVVWAINAALKWLPGYRDSYLAALKGVAQGQPGFLHGLVSLLDHVAVGLTFTLG